MLTTEYGKRYGIIKPLSHALLKVNGEIMLKKYKLNEVHTVARAYSRNKLNDVDMFGCFEDERLTDAVSDMYDGEQTLRTWYHAVNTVGNGWQVCAKKCLRCDDLHGADVYAGLVQQAHSFAAAIMRMIVETNQ